MPAASEVPVMGLFAFEGVGVVGGVGRAALEVTWSVYHNIVNAYRAPDTSAGKALMQADINTLTSTRAPGCQTVLTTLSGMLKRRDGDILAYFDHPHTTGGPTEAINGPFEHLRGSALGFRNITNYITRALLENRRIQTPTTPPIMKSRFSGSSELSVGDRVLSGGCG